MAKISINPHIFRQYDIRGVAGVDLTPEVVEKIGMAFGSRLREIDRSSVVIGRDVRLSSPELAEALCSGLASAGLDVIDVGLVATPILYFSIFHFDAGGGIMITGSHNPVNYNGLKICEGKWPIFGEQIRDLHRRVLDGGFAAGRGRIRRENIIPVYLDQLRERFDPNLDARVVVDAGNGTAGFIVPELLRGLGCEVEELFCDPDGSFPNHLPDPEDPKNVRDLIRRVKETGADAGLAFDGDSDRLGIIDDRGEKVHADRLLLLFARHYLARHPGGKVIFDIKCSDVLEEEVLRAGGIPIRWKTGHSLIKQKMREEGALLAGELSGHICILQDYYGFDDAFFAALLTLEIRKQNGKPLSALLAAFPRTHATHEIKVACPDDRKFPLVKELLAQVKGGGGKVSDLDGARIIHPEGWALIRASNTTPCLTLRFESRSAGGLEQVVLRTRDLLGRFPELDLSPIAEALGDAGEPA